MTTPLPASAGAENAALSGAEYTPTEFIELNLDATGERWVNGLASAYFGDWEDGEWRMAGHRPGGRNDQE
jgi:hypothetical protein